MNDIKSNGLVPIIAQALEVMEAKAGHNIPLDKVNLAELGRLTGLSRSKLRTLKKNNFQDGIKTRSLKYTQESGHDKTKGYTITF